MAKSRSQSQGDSAIREVAVIHRGLFAFETTALAGRLVITAGNHTPVKPDIQHGLQRLRVNAKLAADLLAAHHLMVPDKITDL